MFANTNLFISRSDPNYLVHTVNRIKLTQWIRANRLSLNFPPPPKKNTCFSAIPWTLYHADSIYFDNSPLDNVSDIRFIGVTIDDKLYWRLHVDICKTILRNIGFINKLKTHLPSYSLLYSSLILPYLNYGLLALDNACQSLLDKLLLLQKKALRIIWRTAFLAHTDHLFSENKIMKIKDSHFFFI